ncbi:nucleoside deaminase [soil metagenome]
MTQLITTDTIITEAVLKVIAYIPTKNLLDVIEKGFFQKLTDKHHMRIAVYLAEKSYNEGGCPIGGVIVHNETNLILGKGHNMLVQANNSRIHGEGAAIADAGRVDFSETNMKTTLTPCDRCYADIYMLAFSRVVVGDVTNVRDGNEQRLRDKGVQVDIVEDPKGIALYKKYCEEKPDQNLEDWRGLAAVNAKKRH